MSKFDLGGTDAAGGGSGVCNEEVGVAACAVGVDEGRVGAYVFVEGALEGAPGVATLALLVSVFFRAPDEAVAWTGASPSPLLPLPLLFLLLEPS